MQYRYSLFLIMALFMISPALGATDWYNSEWDYRKNITFNQSQISGSNTDFPALINITDTDLKDHAQNNGDDILFTAGNGSYKLDHEIENFNKDTGHLIAHVKVPNMTNQSQTSILMYYGNSGASNQENVSRVWEKNYTGVWHLKENKSGTGNAGVYNDSTENGNDADDDVSATGKKGWIGRGQEFDGQDDQIEAFFPDSSLLDLEEDSDFTLQAWVRVKSTNGNWMTFLNMGEGTNPGLMLRKDNNDNFGTYDGDNQHNSNLKYETGKWYHFVYTAADGNHILYVNGSNIFEESGVNSAPKMDKIRLGNWDGDQFWDGYGDEVRISNVQRSKDWIITEYRNQRNSDIFYELGEEEQHSRQSEYVRTFVNNTPRGFVANKTKITVRTRGIFDPVPSIRITDSAGNVRVDEVSMVNLSSDNLYEFNYTLNGSSGWYNVKINENIWENQFYQGEGWQSNYTDVDGNKFTFRRKVNVSEPGVGDRWFEPVDVNVGFGFSPDNDSIRVVAWNGSRMLEIPSQIYNVTKSGETVSNANVVFLSSLNQSETRTYYVVSSKSEYSQNYNGLNNTDNAPGEKVENSYFKSYFNQSLGYLMRDVKNKIGTGESLSGTEPMDRYPQVDVPSGLETDTKKARIDSTSSINITEGPLFTEVSVEGGLDGQSNYPYSVDCSIYAANPYMICEKNLTTQVSEDWQNLYFNGLVFEDGKFDWTAYRNSNDDISTKHIGDGDNSDYSGLDSNMAWVTFFDNSTGDAVGEIVLQRNFSTTQNRNFKIKDDGQNDFYQNILISDTSVNAEDYWYSKTARIIYNGLRGSSYVNETYNRLKSPVRTVKGEEVTDDQSVTNYSNTGNVSTNDSSNFKVHSYWVDDTFLDYAKINITGNGVNGSNTELYYNESYDIRDSGDFTNESWVNVTLENSTVNAGEISANITVFDVAGKSNSTAINFNVSDTTPPEYSSIINEPNNSAELDPDQKVNVTANITEYSSVSEAYLYYKNDSAGSFTKKPMFRDGEEDFIHTYKSNFTPAFEDNYTYYISTNDTLDQVRNSSNTKITVAWDYTWNFGPDLDGATDTFNQNVSIGNFTINNTGDFNQSFKLSTGVFNFRTIVNGTKLPATFEIENGSRKLFTVNATTRDSTSTEGLDTFNLTIENSSATPKVNFSGFDVTTSTGGPFLQTEITDYNSTVTQGDSGVRLTAETTNKGKESASTVNITFNLPTGWSVASGEDLTSGNSLIQDVGTTKSFTTRVDIASGASTGKKTLEAVARSQEDNRSTNVDVTVESKSSGNNQQPSESGSGGGGGSASEGSGGTGLSSSQQQKLFQTEEKFEIVRGEDQNFTLTVENPFEEGNLEDVSVNVTGFLSQYLSVEPEEMAKISVNSSENFTVKIEAPRYFNRGEYNLKFNISGINNRSEILSAGNNSYLSRDIRKFRENRQVGLTVHEISREEASKSLNASRKALESLKERGIDNREIEETLKQAEEALNSGNYQKARQLSTQVQEKHEQATKAENTLKDVTNLIEDAEFRGLSAPRTERMASMATAALERGDFSMAASRAEEAKNLYALETKGEINYVNFAQRNWKQLSVALLVMIGLGTGGFLRLRLFRIKRKLSKLEGEEQTLLGLMKQVQRESFEEGKMSMEEYEEAMMQYEKQLSQNVKETVRLESEKAHWLNIRQGQERLEHERDRIQNLMQETQEKYLEKGSIETRVYKQKMQTFRERLTELESQLAEIEAQAEIDQKTGIKQHLAGLR